MPDPMSGGTDQGMLAVARQMQLTLAQMNKTLATVLAVVQSTAPSATSGSASLPANPAGFLNVTLPNGQAVKVPFYNP